MRINKQGFWLSRIYKPPFDDSYSSYTPTFGGFSVDPVVSARYANLGGMVHLWITPSAHGTSNAGGAATLTVSLPIAAAAFAQNIVACRITNNNVSLTVQGLCLIAASASTATIYRDPSAIATWTASGNKSFKMSIFYEASGYTSHTPTFGGFSVAPTVACRYFVNDKFAHLYMSTSAHGTSNATNFTFTLPHTSANTEDQIVPVSVVTNNGIRSASQGLCIITKNSTTATVYRDMNSTLWTASGNKSCNLSIDYEIA